MEEQVSDLVDIQIFIPLVDLLSELKSSFGIDVNHASKLFSVVDFEANLSSVFRSFLQSALFVEDLDNFLVAFRLLIYL